MADDDNAWHLDKKVPVGLMIGLALNAGLGIWYASKLDSRVTYLEQTATLSSQDAQKLKDQAQDSNNRLIHLEDNSNTTLAIVRRWEEKEMGLGQSGRERFTPHEPN